MPMKSKPQKKYIGVFWGKDSLTFVVTTKEGNVNTSFEVNLDSGKSVDPNVLSKSIEDTLNHLNISGLNANLSIPLKDIILRSFTIPWVHAKEVQSIIEFEASKYIPFDLNDLNYSFHSTTIKENSSRSLHIIFIAVKKIVIEKYLTILLNAGLKVGVAEPSPSSLIRLLTFKEVLSAKKSRAILIKNENVSQIIIIDNGIPQFVRDFQTTTPVNSLSDKARDQEISTKFVNEVRISIDFFRRQEQNIEIEEILIISSTPEKAIQERFENDLKTPTTSIVSTDIIQSENLDINGGLNSFGTSIYNQVRNDGDFNFLGTKRKSLAPSPELVKILLSKSVIITFILSVVALFSIYIFLNRPYTQLLSKVNTLNSTIGSKKNLGQKKLESSQKEIKEELEKIKLIQTQTETTFFLASLSNLRPKGVWLNDVKISFRNNENLSPILKISGNGYLKNINEQNKLANKFLKRLKSDKAFSERFSNIELNSIKSKTIDEYNIVDFKLTCE